MATTTVLKRASTPKCDLVRGGTIGASKAVESEVFVANNKDLRRSAGGHRAGRGRRGEKTF